MIVRKISYVDYGSITDTEKNARWRKRKGYRPPLSIEASYTALVVGEGFMPCLARARRQRL